MLNHRLLTLGATVVAATATLGAGPAIAVAPAHADADLYIAVAYSESEDDAYFVWDASSRNQAESDAMSDCKADANDCKLLASTKNTCVAVADSETHVAAGSGATASAAKTDALSRNGGGSVIGVHCTGS